MPQSPLKVSSCLRIGYLGNAHVNAYRCPVVTKQAGAGGVTRTWMPMARLRPDCDYVHPNAALVTSCWCD